MNKKDVATTTHIGYELRLRKHIAHQSSRLTIPLAELRRLSTYPKGEQVLNTRYWIDVTNDIVARLQEEFEEYLKVTANQER